MYRETSEEETRQLDQQLTTDAELRTALYDLSNMMYCLDQALISPSPAATSRIWSSTGLSKI